MSDAIEYTADVVWMKFVALNRHTKRLKLDIKFIPEITKNCLIEERVIQLSSVFLPGNNILYTNRL